MRKARQGQGGERERGERRDDGARRNGPPHARADTPHAHGPKGRRDGARHEKAGLGKARHGKPPQGKSHEGRPHEGRPHGAKPHRPRTPFHRARPTGGAPESEMRIAKALARAGLCSRREAERWIVEGRVSVNGKTIDSPALDVGPKDRISVDGNPLPVAEPTRLWRYHKPKGLVTTHRDPQGRPTVFDALPNSLPRVISVGRLDFNSEGLLLLTNDGALARHLELPATGWLRRYRVRAYGHVTQADLDRLKDGIEVEGVKYGPIEAALDTEKGDNAWITIALREGKNREVRNILSALGLTVNRLIRVSFGPFQLLELKPGDVENVRRRVIIDQLGPRIAEELGLVDDEVEDVPKIAPRHKPPREKPAPDKPTGEKPPRVRKEKGERA